MDLTDSDIEAILESSDVTPEQLAYIMGAAGVVPSDDAVADVRALAQQLGLPVLDMLYGFYAEDSPLFADLVTEEEEGWPDEYDDETE